MAKRSLSFSEGKSKKAKRQSKKPSVSAIVQREILKTADIKELSTYATAQASTTTGTVVCINQIAEGDDYNGRTGRRIATHDIDIMYTYSSSGSAVTSGYQVALVYDGDANGTAATYSQIFEAVGASPAGMGFKNTVNWNKRFRVYWMDCGPKQALAPATNNGAFYLEKQRHYIKPKNDEEKNVRYGNTTAVTPNKGAWYLVFGDETNTATLSSIRYLVKYRYTDN